jgi:hypothetical protein
MPAPVKAAIHCGAAFAVSLALAACSIVNISLASAVLTERRFRGGIFFAGPFLFFADLREK